jgi:hypothetical protein
MESSLQSSAMPLTKSKSYSSMSKIPEFLIFPPLEENYSEPCLAWEPDEGIVGLPNPTKSDLVSCINAIVQIFCCLPELNKELPIETDNESISMFREVVHAVQKNKTRPQIYSVGGPTSEPKENFGSLVQKLHEEIQQRVSHMHEVDFISVYQTIFDTGIKNTRFGQRFEFQPDYDIPYLLPLDYLFDSNRPVALVEILNSCFSMPSFFFGGQLIPKQREYSKLLSLPHFLTFYFNRKAGNSLNSAILEIPLEIDMGKFMDPKARKPQTSAHYRGSPTFYKLHGFVTQKEGHYLIYSRLRSGSRWYKIEDGVVEQAELGMQIHSRGLVLAIYRLQEI